MSVRISEKYPSRFQLFPHVHRCSSRSVVIYGGEGRGAPQSLHLVGCEPQGRKFCSSPKWNAEPRDRNWCSASSEEKFLPKNLKCRVTERPLIPAPDAT